METLRFHKNYTGSIDWETIWCKQAIQPDSSLLHWQKKVFKRKGKWNCRTGCKQRKEETHMPKHIMCPS